MEAQEGTLLIPPRKSPQIPSSFLLLLVDTMVHPGSHLHVETSLFCLWMTAEEMKSVYLQESIE